MKRKRRLLILLGLLLMLAMTLVMDSYLRQLVFGPRIHGVPLCVWQEDFRKRHGGPDVNRGFIGKILAWLRPRRSAFEWSSTMLTGPEQQALFASLIDDPNSRVRMGILRALTLASWKETPGEETKCMVSQGHAEFLLQLLDDRDQEIVYHACGFLKFAPELFDAALPKLKGLLKHPNPEHRAAGTMAIAEHYGSSKAIPKEKLDTLLTMLSDSHFIVRWTALKTVPWGPEAKDAIPTLTTLLDNQNHAEAAALALTAIDPVRYRKAE